MKRLIVKRAKRRSSPKARPYSRGARHANSRHAPLEVAGRTSAGAVLVAPGHPDALRASLRKLRELPLQEIVVALPGNADPALAEAARSQPGVIVFHRPDLQDPDAALALGSTLTQSEVILFVDGQQPGKADELARFIRACVSGKDIALNDIAKHLGLFGKRHAPYRLAEFLNRILNRQDLRANSLASLPFAMNRKALAMLGPDMLAHPAKAQAAALKSGLQVGIGGSVPVFRPVSDDAAAKEAAEYAEAWRMVLEGQDSRMAFPDRLRNRTVLEEWT